MSNVKVNFETERVFKIYNEEIKQAMWRAILIIEADAKRNAPVDTGNLRSAITSMVEQIAADAMQGQVGAPVEYALFVELGTSKMSAQPYLRPALRNNFSKVVSIIQEAIE